MTSVLVWVTTAVSALILLITGHILITVVLSKLRDLLKPAIKDEKAMSGIMTLLIILVVVMVLNSLIQVFGPLENNILNMLEVFQPGLNLMVEFGKYIGYVVLGFVVVLGLKYLK